MGRLRKIDTILPDFFADMLYSNESIYGSWKKFKILKKLVFPKIDKKKKE